MSFLSKEENAPSGKQKGSVREEMIVHSPTLLTLGVRAKVRRAAGLRVEVRKEINLVLLAEARGPPLLVKRKRGLPRVAAETGDRHLQPILVEQALLVTIGMSLAVSSTELALVKPEKNVFSNTATISLQPLSLQGGILLKSPTGPTRATRLKRPCAYWLHLSPPALYSSRLNFQVLQPLRILSWGHAGMLGICTSRCTNRLPYRIFTAKSSRIPAKRDEAPGRLSHRRKGNLTRKRNPLHQIPAKRDEAPSRLSHRRKGNLTQKRNPLHFTGNLVRKTSAAVSRHGRRESVLCPCPKKSPSS